MSLRRLFPISTSKFLAARSDRRGWIQRVLSAGGGLLMLSQQIPISSALGDTPGVDVPELRETLAAGLKARLPREFRFVDRVVTMVENRRLPMPLVQSTFQWARKKARVTPYPFPYFERGLRVRAAREGIRIP